MAEIGRMNSLRIIKKLDFGIYLDGGDLGEILMPIRYVPESCAIDDELEVFVYRDSEDRLIATTEEPFAMVGEFALLQAVAVNRVGAFLKWGLMKDLLVPFSEQKPRMEEGRLYVVRIFLDDDGRILASARLDGFLHRESDDEFEAGEAVNLFIANRTDLGYQVIVENSHWGMLHNNEVPKGLKRGEIVAGFIKNIREEDGRIDLCLHLKPSEKTDEISSIVIEKLKLNAGFLALNDKSSPDDIRATLGISKGMYKKAVGALYKKKLISLEKDGVRLLKA